MFYEPVYISLCYRVKYSPYFFYPRVIQFSMIFFICADFYHNKYDKYDVPLPSPSKKVYLWLRDLFFKETKPPFELVFPAWQLTLLLLTFRNKMADFVEKPVSPRGNSRCTNQAAQQPNTSRRQGSPSRGDIIITPFERILVKLC